MCEYCAYDYEEYPKKEKYSKIKSENEDVYAFIDRKRKKLIFRCFVDCEDPYTAEGAIKINYCPICGRKLHD